MKKGADFKELVPGGGIGEEHQVLPVAVTVDEELWRRSEARREASLYPEASGDDRLLLPLVLSLARLAAQRDTRGGA